MNTRATPRNYLLYKHGQDKEEGKENPKAKPWISHFSKDLKIQIIIFLFGPYKESIILTTFYGHQCHGWVKLTL